MAAPITLRLAQARDARRLWRWRNDPQTRAMSRSTAPIAWTTHQRWFRDVLQNPTRQLYIGERAGHPVAALRVDECGDGRELSWMVAPEARRQGIGRQLVAAGVAITTGRLVADIKPENVASQRIAQALGFHAHRPTDGIARWVLERH